MTGYILKTDGAVEHVACNMLAYEAMCKALDCRTVQRVDLIRVGHCEIWCDEEGLLKAAPAVNGTATTIYQAAYGPDVGICGTAYLRVRKGYTLSGTRVVKTTAPTGATKAQERVIR